jgi:endoglucanase
MYAATNYGQDSQLLLKKWQRDYNREAFVQFDLSTITTVSSAKLRLFGNLQDANIAAIQVGVFDAPGTWTESAITWNNRPAAGAQLASFTVSGTTARWYEIDLTAFIKAQKAAARATASLVLKGLTASTTVTTFGSDETSSGPQLLVTVA